MTDTMDAFEALKKRVNQLGLKVQTLATHIEEEVAEINEQIDNVTLQCMEGQEANNEELKKLRTLATALKALS